MKFARCETVYFLKDDHINPMQYRFGTRLAMRTAGFGGAARKIWIKVRKYEKTDSRSAGVHNFSVDKALREE